MAGEDVTEVDAAAGEDEARSGSRATAVRVVTERKSKRWL